MACYSWAGFGKPPGVLWMVWAAVFVMSLSGMAMGSSENRLLVPHQSGSKGGPAEDDHHSAENPQQEHHPSASFSLISSKTLILNINYKQDDSMEERNHTILQLKMCGYNTNYTALLEMINNTLYINETIRCKEENKTEKLSLELKIYNSTGVSFMFSYDSDKTPPGLKDNICENITSMTDSTEDGVQNYRSERKKIGKEDQQGNSWNLMEMNLKVTVSSNKASSTPQMTDPGRIKNTTEEATSSSTPQGEDSSDEETDTDADKRNDKSDAATAIGVPESSTSQEENTTAIGVPESSTSQERHWFVVAHVFIVLFVVLLVGCLVFVVWSHRKKILRRRVDSPHQSLLPLTSLPPSHSPLPDEARTSLNKRYSSLKTISDGNISPNGLPAGARPALPTTGPPSIPCLPPDDDEEDDYADPTEFDMGRKIPEVVVITGDDDDDDDDHDYEYIDRNVLMMQLQRDAVKRATLERGQDALSAYDSNNSLYGEMADVGTRGEDESDSENSLYEEVTLPLNAGELGFGGVGGIGGEEREKEGEEKIESDSENSLYEEVKLQTTEMEKQVPDSPEKGREDVEEPSSSERKGSDKNGEEGGKKEEEGKREEEGKKEEGKGEEAGKKEEEGKEEGSVSNSPFEELGMTNVVTDKEEEEDKQCQRVDEGKEIAPDMPNGEKEKDEEGVGRSGKEGGGDGEEEEVEKEPGEGGEEESREKTDLASKESSESDDEEEESKERVDEGEKEDEEKGDKKEEDNRSEDITESVKL